MGRKEHKAKYKWFLEKYVLFLKVTSCCGVILENLSHHCHGTLEYIMQYTQVIRYNLNNCENWVSTLLKEKHLQEQPISKKITEAKSNKKIMNNVRGP